MGSRVGVLCLLVLVISLMYAEAIRLEITGSMVAQTDDEIPEIGSIISEPVGNRKKKLCEFCENITTDAIRYLGENVTQTAIINTLHGYCYKLQPLEQKCMLLVDYLLTILFAEVAVLQPDKFCENVDICENLVFVPSVNGVEVCKVCNYLVNKTVTALEDQEIQNELVKKFRKGCESLNDVLPKCKKLVNQYVPLVMTITVKFLKTNDVCATFFSCPANQEPSVGPEILAEMFLRDALRGWEVEEGVAVE